MKNTMMLTAAALMGAWTLSAETLASGITFHTPAGWQANVVQDAAALQAPNHSQQNELYVIAPLAGVKDANDPQIATVLQNKLLSDGITARPVGQPIVFQADGGAGKVFAYDMAKGGEQGRMLLFVVGLKRGGAAMLLAAGTTQMLAMRQSALAELAASIGHNGAASAAPAPVMSSSSPVVRQWTQQLSDKKLVYMSSYNSGGGGGGYSSEKKLYLASDGSYAFRSQSSVSIYVPGANGGSNGQNAQQGRWRVVEEGGQAILELTAQNGAKEIIRLSMQGTKTFLNGNRWFVVGINE